MGAAAGRLLHLQKSRDAGPRGQRQGAGGVKPLRPTEAKHHQSQRVPEPSIAAAGGANHPHANPTRRTPALYEAHQAVVPPRDVTQHTLTGVDAWPDGFHA